MGESLGPRRFTFPQSIKNIKPERETFSNYSNKKKIKKYFQLFNFYSQRDFIKKKNGIFRSGPTGLEYGEALHHESP